MTTPGRKVDVVCFDVDGTLIRQREDRTVWQLVNTHYHGEAATNRLRFRAFRDGLLSYPEWVALDILDWKSRGARRDEIERLIRENLSLVDGVPETVRALRDAGLKVGIVSGTLNLTIEMFLGDIEFDAIYSNRIWFDGDGKIGGFEPTPFDVDGKAAAIAQIAESFGTSLERCAFVGDSWNDRTAFRRVGLAIAFEPKDDVVRELADEVIENNPMTQVLDFVL